VSDNSNVGLAKFILVVLDMLYGRLTTLLVWASVFGMGVAWFHFVGPVSGYFLALVLFGLSALVIGTVIYAAFRMRSAPKRGQ
jgi:hypothetical protein